MKNSLQTLALHRPIVAFSILLGLLMISPMHAVADDKQDPGKPKGDSKLVVILTGLENTKGFVRVSLYNNASSWKSSMEQERRVKDYRFLKIPAGKSSRGRLVINFDEIEAGTYAVSLFHDENGNGKTDKDFLGLNPTEGFGFSRNFNPRAKLRAPKFSECTFDVAKEKTTQISIKLL